MPSSTGKGAEMNERTMQLGVGAVRWQMPSLVHRLEVLNRQATDGLASARMYALLAGLPGGVLTAVGLTGRPAMDIDQAEQLLQRQGCTLPQLIAASAQAWQAVWEWYTEAMPTPKDEADAGNDDTPPATVADTTD